LACIIIDLARIAILRNPRNVSADLLKQLIFLLNAFIFLYSL
jgi:hypothetical protein